MPVQILGILQARCSSSRLPNKVLMPLLGKPMLIRQLERLSQSKLLDKIVVATSSDSSDDQLSEILKFNNYEVFRGSLDDVLDRFYQAALLYKPQFVVRITGDCPLIDPQVLDETVKLHIGGNYDYTSNCHIPTYPDGFSIEVFGFNHLETALKNASLPSEREHVTPHFYNNPNKFKIGLLKSKEDLSGLRLTVDYSEDFEVVRQVFEALYEKNSRFGMYEIIDFLAGHPEIASLNSKYIRGEGLRKSLKEDQAFRNRNDV